MSSLLGALLALSLSFGAAADEMRAARARWAASPHGPMLERILPPGFEPADLPDRASPGAKLTARYCVQCHNLANPAMHEDKKWPGVVERMVLRMQGKGNLGKLMGQMMAGVEAPPAEDVRILVAYLRRHAQKALDPKRHPEAYQAAGESFRLACNQCHVLPDPRRYTAQQWPAVVARMEKNMAWMNRVESSKPMPGDLQLRVEDINAFLAKYARRAGSLP